MSAPQRKEARSDRARVRTPSAAGTTHAQAAGEHGSVVSPSGDQPLTTAPATACSKVTRVTKHDPTMTWVIAYIYNGY